MDLEHQSINQYEQQPPLLGVVSSPPASLWPPLTTVFVLLGSAMRAFLLTILWISRKTVWNASITFTASNADVSMKDMPCFSASAVASSTVTSRMWARSLLFPTSITTTLESEWTARTTTIEFVYKFIMIKQQQVDYGKQCGQIYSVTYCGFTLGSKTRETPTSSNPIGQEGQSATCEKGKWP